MEQFSRINLFLFLMLFGVYTSPAQSVGGVTTGAVSFCSGINSGFVSLSNYSGSIINWQSTTNGGLTWNTIANTNQNQTYFNLAQTTCYRAIVQDGVYPADTSSIVCITVIPASYGGVVDGGGSFCSNSDDDTLHLSGNVGSVLFWLYSTGNGSNWATIPNTNNWLYYSNISENTNFYAVVQNSVLCGNDTSLQAVFIIDSSTITGTINNGATVCESVNNGSVALFGFRGNILGWESSVNNGGNWTSINNYSPIQSYQNLSQSTWYRTFVKNGSCETDTSSYTVVIVDSMPVSGTLSGGNSYCGAAPAGALTLYGNSGNITGWISSTTNGLNWTSIANTSAVENYSNLQSTTWYSAIVKNGVCPADTTNIEIIAIAPQTDAGIILGEANVCYDFNAGTLNLTGNIGSVKGWLYSTDAGANWNSLTNETVAQPYSGLTQTTWYKVIVQSFNCDIDTTVSTVITIFPQSNVNAGNDTNFISGQSITLQGTGIGIPLWTPDTGLDNPEIFNPVATPNGTVSYVLTVTDANSCINSDTVSFTEISADFKGVVSTLFTPNADGINDTWYIQDIQRYPGNEVFVYNIYGNEVFSAKDYNNNWRGTYKNSELPDGTYFYVVKTGNSSKVLKGSVDILRNN